LIVAFAALVVKLELPPTVTVPVSLTLPVVAVAVRLPPTGEAERGVPYASEMERELEPASAEPEQPHKPEPAHPVETVTEKPANPRRGWWQRLIQS